MKSTEPTQNVSGGQNKPPPYPVEPSTMIVEPAAPDPYTADLLSAVQYGYYDRVVELIEPNPSLATTPTNGNITLLHWAAINDRVEIGEYLLSKNASIDALGGELSSTPLHWAARNGKLRMVVYLLSRQANALLFDGEGFSTIHLATMFGHTETVAYLIARGHEIDVFDQNGMTPLMHAAEKIKQRDPMQILIRLGARVNLQNPKNHFTALHYAVLGRNPEAIRLLIKAGAHIDIPNSNNETPFDFVREKPDYLSLFLTNSSQTSSPPANPRLPRFLQMNGDRRRLGTKILPFLIIFLIAVILQMNIWWIFRIVLLILLILFGKGYAMIFFDQNVDRYLPISIAQASIFWLYACYLYYFLPYVHVFSWGFIGLAICTYYSWSNFYYATKSDPGVIWSDREQQYQNIIELIEQNQFNIETFCTACLIRRPIRSKHCRECHRCVAKFDHHCPWIDNCVGEKNLRYFTGFLFFTPICLAFYLYGAFVFYRDHCDLLITSTPIDLFIQIITCSPAVLWLTVIAFLHIIWVTALCLTILCQIASGYTTNEKMNSWRYTHLKSRRSNPFSFGCRQNLVDLIHRKILCYSPIKLDWTRIYSLDDFHQFVSGQNHRDKTTDRSSDNKNSRDSFNV